MPYKNLADRNANTQRRREDPAYVARVNEIARKAYAVRVAGETAREAHRRKTRKWKEANLEKTRALNRASAAKQRAEHPEKTTAHARKAQTARLKRYPAWADDEKIQKVYADAKTMSEITGEPWHVDHIVPLQGKTVSGLHVHYNLQILPGAENLQKHNKFEPGDV